MSKYIDTVQKRIGLLISVVGTAVIIVNIIDGIKMVDFIYAISDISVWLLFLTVVPFIISIFIENTFLKFVQIFFILITGIVNIMDSYQEFYGPGMFLIGWLLMRHYGFLDNYRKTKNTAILVLMVGLSQLSAFLNTRDGIYAGLTTLLYTMFLIIMIIIIWRDMILEQTRLKVENRSLRVNYTRIRDQLIELEEEQKPYNFKAVKITPAEERVIKILTIYKASNREIAERLNIAEPTVKLHLYNIYNKIGVDNRFAIIDLCKYNYT